MQDIFYSVRRALVFRPSADTEEEETSPPPVASTSATTAGALVERISSCIRKSRVFSKDTCPSVSRDSVPPICWRKGQLIGCGAFGRVYMGMDLDSGELLAFKEIDKFDSMVGTPYDLNKAVELKKLQTLLYGEFYNSLNVAHSTVFLDCLGEEAESNYLKLPPKSRSPVRCPVGTPSATIDVVSSAIPGSNNSGHAWNIDHKSGQSSPDIGSSQLSELKSCREEMMLRAGLGAFSWGNKALSMEVQNMIISANWPMQRITQPFERSSSSSSGQASVCS
ncbi:hypothetical protein SAY87_015421 [Trapa incisa]|uniref:Uncharacterized protein n=1 Tax=Trapa incisa TaxID=236973 RepID=A0AAN7GLM9_9MYRT|nr:hypothetical protein SAY87_015421 [Trapa incisa]